jgi:hypothetical protein
MRRTCRDEQSQEERRTRSPTYSSAPSRLRALWLLRQPPAPTGEPLVLLFFLGTVYRNPSPFQALPGPRNPGGLPSPGLGNRSRASQSSVVPQEVYSIVLRGLLEISSLPATSDCQNEVSTWWLRRGWLMRYRAVPASDRCRNNTAPSQSLDYWDVSRKPILVMRVSRDPRLESPGPGATADHGGDSGGPVHQMSRVPRKLVVSYVRALPVTVAVLYSIRLARRFRCGTTTHNPHYLKQSIDR